MSRNRYDVPEGHLLEGQFQHLLMLLVLVMGAYFLATPVLGDDVWIGISDSQWFTAGVVVVIVHQVVVAFAFRLQLTRSIFTRAFGENDLLVWGIIFFPLLFLRPILTLALGITDSGSLTPFPIFQTILGIFLLIPALYTFYSIRRYFGMVRALGADHFRAEYKDKPLVREGAFKYSSNAMYAFGFLLLWGIALLSRSQAALALALFQHAYIWVHMYCTEEPDMRVIYGSG